MSASRTVRTATLEDMPALLEYGRAFHGYSPYRDTRYEPEAVEPFFERLIEGGGMFITEGGMCGGMLMPLYFAPSTVIAAELFWWAPKGGGRTLREAFEAWARARGADRVQFSALSDERLPRVAENYRLNGYEPAEVTFLKRI